MSDGLVRFNRYTAPYWDAIDEAERDRIRASVRYDFPGYYLSIGYGTQPGDWSVRLVPDVPHGVPVAHVQHGLDLATTCRQVLAEARAA
jgi:hypothetical protein